MRWIEHAVCWLLLGTAVSAPAANILVLKSQNSEPYNQALAGFKAACGAEFAELNLNGSKTRRAEFIARVTEEKPRLIVAIGPLAAQMAQAESNGLPILFLMVSNPVRHGLRGDNIAGVSLDIPVTNQFARYRSLMPALKTMGVIYDPSKTAALIAEAKSAATNAGIELIAVEIDSQRKIRDALKGLIERKIDALWMVPDETVITPESFKFLAGETSKNHIAFLAASEIFVEVGALAALTPDYKDVGRQACSLAQAIQNGERKPTDVGTTPPAEVHLILNLKTASKIGLSVPQPVVASASKVYQ
jgi:putative ABC transport system substrate-binding protein